MVSPQVMKTHEIQSLEEYFELIIDSKRNGQQRQVENQWRLLSKDQKKEFLHYLTDILKHSTKLGEDKPYIDLIHATLKNCIDLLY